MSGFTPYSDEHELQIQFAKDLIGGLISIRSSWIHEEEHKPEPDLSQIEAWADEQGDFVSLRERLVMMNEGEFAEIFRKYRPQHEAENAIWDAQYKARRVNNGQ